eukprot:gene5314-gene8346
MSNFSAAKIYKIFNSVNPKVYVGSTTRTLETRLIEHNCGIEIVEEYPCKNLSELKVKEAYWKSKLNCVNKHT